MNKILKIDLKILQKTILEIQKDKGITNYRISKEINISNSTMKRFLTGENELSLSKLIALLDYLVGKEMGILHG